MPCRTSTRQPNQNIASKGGLMQRVWFVAAGWLIPALGAVAGLRISSSIIATLSGLNLGFIEPRQYAHRVATIIGSGAIADAGFLPATFCPIKSASWRSRLAENPSAIWRYEAKGVSHG
jgi:hypothetical protein